MRDPCVHMTGSVQQNPRQTETTIMDVAIMVPHAPRGWGHWRTLIELAHVQMQAWKPGGGDGDAGGEDGAAADDGPFHLGAVACG
jgi:hypothetical protein